MDPNFNYTQTTVACPTAPNAAPMTMDVMRPMIRDIFTDYPTEEPMLSQEFTSAASIFKGNDVIQSDDLRRNIRFGQRLTVTVLKDQNPLSLYGSSEIEYDDIDACHDQISLACSVNCISTTPEFQRLEIAFDHEYTYGVRACAKDTQFWDFDLYYRQYRLSKGGYEFGRELDAWNTFVDGIIAAPATTVDIKVAENHATQYWANLGSVAANARMEIATAYQYMVNAYRDFNPLVVMPYELAGELILSVENPYNLNLSQTRVNTYEAWNIPGYEQNAAVAAILGIPDASRVLVMKRSPWMAAQGCNRFPLWNDDMTKQYVAIFDPRVLYDFEIPGFHLDIRPYDCDKLVEGQIETVYVAMGITFPQYGMILEFDQTSHSGTGGDTNATAIAFAENEAEVNVDATVDVEFTLTPANATTPVVLTSSNPEVATVARGEGNKATITGVAAGTAAITATAGNVNSTVVVTVAAA